MISLGVDIGGTGAKCVAFSEQGVQLGLAYSEYKVPAGTVNLPAKLLSDSVMEVIRNCTSQLDNPEEVAALTFSSFGESFVAIDEQGEPLDDIRMYFGNSESEDFDRLVARVGETEFMEVCRILPDASYSLSKMLYTLKIAPRPVYKFLLISGYICYLLTGRAATDMALASRTLLFDPRAQKWSDKLLKASGIRLDQLPEVVPYGTSLGNILPYMAQKLGLPKTAQIVMGAHDQIANALGAGVVQVGDAVDTSGTTECITPLFAQVPENEAFQKENYATIPYLQGRGYVTYAYNISAGSVVRWYRDILGQSLNEEATAQGKSIYDLLNEAAPVKPTSLMVLPFLQGMGGTPDVDPYATGLIAGLTTQTRLPDLYRAVLEGITFEMRYNQEKLRENGIAFERLLACGGGAKSPVWLQIKADILGCEVVPVQTEETGAMGCAILGFAAITGEDPFAIAEKLRKYGEPIIPVKENQSVYNKRYELYKQLRSFWGKHS